MFGKRITLFRILGFEVHVDPSWLVLALLISWTLATGLFPSQLKGLSQTTYWWMGVAGALGLFASILSHEFCHSLVAQQFGLPMKGITLFIFGGVAEMNEEPHSPKAEFFMAIAGPLSSIALGFLFYASSALFERLAIDAAVVAVIGYLASINWILAIFNLLPAFPLDGGRVLRSILWHWKKSLRRATRISSRIGEGFGIAFILLGLVNVLRGNLVGGLWQSLIGMFLRSAAESSYRQVVVLGTLEGEPVSRFMNRQPVTAPPSISIRELVEHYVYRYHYKMFPVMEDDRVIGCITTRRIGEIPREEWDRRTVAEAADRCAIDSAVAPDADTAKVLSLMGRTGKSRLMVMDGDRLLGIVSLKDIMGYVAAKSDLEAGGNGSDELPR